jgi:hypothetical protein
MLSELRPIIPSRFFSKRRQGDQIGRILSQLFFAYSLQFLKMIKVFSPHFWVPFSTNKFMHLFFYKNGLGYILEDFFTNSSGHPGLAVTTERDESFY